MVVIESRVVAGDEGGPWRYDQVAGQIVNRHDHIRQVRKREEDELLGAEVRFREHPPARHPRGPVKALLSQLDSRMSTLAGEIEGRMSAINMTTESSHRIQLLQGTLDMLILRTLLFGPAHGHQIAKHIQRTTEDLLQVEHGSLYPALHRLERRGWIAAKWERAGKDMKREFKFYGLTAAGRKQLVAEESKWKKLTGAVARVMWPAQEG
jgi:transcriptional regulator